MTSPLLKVCKIQERDIYVILDGEMCYSETFRSRDAASVFALYCQQANPMTRDYKFAQAAKEIEAFVDLYLDSTLGPVLTDGQLLTAFLESQKDVAA